MEQSQVSDEEIRRVRNTVVGKDYVKIWSKMLYYLCTELLYLREANRMALRAAPGVGEPTQWDLENTGFDAGSAKRKDTPAGQGAEAVVDMCHDCGTTTGNYSDDCPEAAAQPAHGERELVAWRCFHCDEVFTNKDCAAEHFGRDESREAACQIKAGAERSMVKALRNAEDAAAKAWDAVHSESTDAAQAYHAQASRHRAQLQATEELGYERGLKDGRALATPAKQPEGGELLRDARKFVQAASTIDYNERVEMLRRIDAFLRGGSLITKDNT